MYGATRPKRKSYAHFWTYFQVPTVRFTLEFTVGLYPDSMQT